jgi:hypothetical protein
MITRDIKYEMPEIFREQDPNQQVAQKQLERLAGLVPLEFGSDIFDWLARPQAPTSISFPDTDPLQSNTFSNYTYNTVYRTTTTTGGGAKTATFIVGPSSNSDSDSYDYVTDGINDDVQIQAAIDALPATGGTVLLREGTYTINYTGVAEISSSKTGVHLCGMGRGTILKFENNISDDASMLYLSGSDCKITDIYFDGNLTNASGSAGYSAYALRTGTRATVKGCYFTDVRGSAIRSGTYNLITDNYFLNNDPSGRAEDLFIIYLDLGSRFSNNHIIQNDALVLEIEAPITYVGGSDHCVVSDNFMQTPNGFAGGCIAVYYGCVCADNVLINQGANGDNGAFYISVGQEGSVVIGNTIVAYEYGTANASVGIYSTDYCVIANNYIEGVHGDGINSQAGYTNISNNHIVLCAQNGIILDGVRNAVTGNVIERCGRATDNTYSGIKFENSVDYSVVTNNTINGDGVTNDLKYCIEEVSGCDYNIIEHNIATGADTAQINVVGANTISANNITA